MIKVLSIGVVVAAAMIGPAFGQDQATIDANNAIAAANAAAAASASQAATNFQYGTAGIEPYCENYGTCQHNNTSSDLGSGPGLLSLFGIGGTAQAQPSASPREAPYRDAQPYHRRHRHRYRSVYR